MGLALMALLIVLTLWGLGIGVTLCALAWRRRTQRKRCAQGRHRYGKWRFNPWGQMLHTCKACGHTVEYPVWAR